MRKVQGKVKQMSNQMLLQTNKMRQSISDSEVQNGCCFPSTLQISQEHVDQHLETTGKGILGNVVQSSQTDTLQSHTNIREDSAVLKPSFK